MRFSGLPERPKPPLMIVTPSATSNRAESASLKVLSIGRSLHRTPSLLQQTSFDIQRAVQTEPEMSFDIQRAVQTEGTDVL